jgi:hypothetical protein
MSFPIWKRLQAWWRGDETDDAVAAEPLPRPEEDGLPVDRPAEHSFDRDSRWTGTYPS